MRIKDRLEQLETRLRALEEAATPKQPGHGVDDPAIQQLIAQSEQAMAVLNDLRGQLGRIQDADRQTQEEHTDALTEIRERE